VRVEAGSHCHESVSNRLVPSELLTELVDHRPQAFASSLLDQFAEALTVTEAPISGHGDGVDDETPEVGLVHEHAQSVGRVEHVRH
jgi:hypothetical protein